MRPSRNLRIPHGASVCLLLLLLLSPAPTMGEAAGKTNPPPPGSSSSTQLLRAPTTARSFSSTTRTAPVTDRFRREERLLSEDGDGGDGGAAGPPPDGETQQQEEEEEPADAAADAADDPAATVVLSPDDYSGDPDNHQPIKFGRKQLVLFAGPHNSASTSVEEFMAEWAEHGWRRGHPHTKSLGLWRWPRVQGTYGTHGTKVFGRMVTEPNNDILHRTILDSISNSMTESENGVIVGTEEFDQVGKDATFKAVPAMKKIIRHLSISDDDVTVVLNYRSPRLDQWVSIWKHEKGTFSDSTYEDFLCLSHNDPAEKRRRLDMLGAQMNPLGAAKAFLEEGWKVRIVDMGGVDTANRDVSHVIGCRVLLAGCGDGFLGNLGDELPRENAVEKPFDEVNDEDSAEMEELFRNRDCGYKAVLEPYVSSGKLKVEYQESLWSTCESSRKSYYAGLVDATDVLFAAFLSQLECKDNPYNIDQVTMDQALGRNETIGHVFNGFVEVVLIPLVFLGGIAYVMLMMFKGKQQERLDKRAAAVAQAEMTAYPSSAFQDNHDDDDEEEGESDGDDDGDDDVEEVYHDVPSK